MDTEVRYRAPVKGFKKCDVPVGTAGKHAVSRFTLDKGINQDGGPNGKILKELGGMPSRRIPRGSYTRLVRYNALGHGIIVMSDTPAEMKEHVEFVKRATKQKGSRILIFGLGLGVCAEAVLMSPNVEHVDIVELSEEVIALVGPHLKARYGDRLMIHTGDAKTWEHPEPATMWTETWFDIWDTINDEFLPQMAEFRARLAPRTTGTVGCWSEDESRRMGFVFTAMEQIQAELGDGLHRLSQHERVDKARTRVALLRAQAGESP